MKQYEIWCEGYAATGERGTAHRMGWHIGESFQDACDRFFMERDPNNSSYSSKNLTYWGCRLFDNEADARRSFG